MRSLSLVWCWCALVSTACATPLFQIEHHIDGPFYGLPATAPVEIGFRIGRTVSEWPDFIPKFVGIEHHEFVPASGLPGTDTIVTGRPVAVDESLIIDWGYDRPLIGGNPIPWLDQNAPGLVQRLAIWPLYESSATAIERRISNYSHRAFGERDSWLTADVTWIVHGYQGAVPEPLSLVFGQSGLVTLLLGCGHYRRRSGERACPRINRACITT